MKLPDAGLYLLVLVLKKGQAIKAGKLSENYFKPGYYLYAGRAKQGVRKRIKRHLRKDKKLFWHIDYLLAKAEIGDVWVKLGSFDECEMLRRLKKYLRKSEIAQKKFGASDCRCSGHLVYVPEAGQLENLKKWLGFEKFRA